jgi:hypothetical protein
MKLPRFTLRELFLLVVIAAMGCGWWVRERAIVSREKDVKQKWQELKLIDEEQMRMEVRLIGATAEVDNRRRALGLPALPPPR